MATASVYIGFRLFIFAHVSHRGIDKRKNKQNRELMYQCCCGLVWLQSSHFLKSKIWNCHEICLIVIDWYQHIATESPTNTLKRQCISRIVVDMVPHARTHTSTDRSTNWFSLALPKERVRVRVSVRTFNRRRRRRHTKIVIIFRFRSNGKTNKTDWPGRAGAADHNFLSFFPFFCCAATRWNFFGSDVRRFVMMSVDVSLRAHSDVRWDQNRPIFLFGTKRVRASLSV